MSTPSSTRLQSLVLLALVVGRPFGQEPEVSLRAHPAPEVALVYAFVQRVSARLKSAGHADGSVPPEYEGLKSETEFREEIQFKDEILRQEAAGVDVLEMYRTVLRARRTCRQEGYSIEQGQWNNSYEFASLLEERKLLFSRPDAESDFSLSIAPPEEPAPGAEPATTVLLEDDVAPRLDLGFSALLPEGPVSVGESWTPSSAAFSCVLRPGGELGFRSIQNGLRDGVYGQKEPDGGNLSCTLKALDAQGGSRLATIEVKGKLEGRTPSTFEVEKDAVRGDDWTADLNVERWRTSEWCLEGKVVWDVGGGHPTELVLSGPVEIVDYMQARSEDTGPPDMDLRWVRVGTVALEVEVQRAPEGEQGKTTAEKDR